LIFRGTSCATKEVHHCQYVQVFFEAVLTALKR
jgi:hypothetical protein